MWAEYGALTRVMVNYGKYINENRSFSVALFPGPGVLGGLPPLGPKVYIFFYWKIFLIIY